MSEKSIPSSPYDPEKFIDREEEINRVISLLQQSHPQVRVLVIDGDRGVGKTWLSLHLHRTKFKNEVRGVKSWLFSLCSPGENYRPEGDKPQNNEIFVRENEQIDIDRFLSTIIRSLSIELPPNPALVERVDAIRRFIQSHSDERFVLILDSAYESDWKLLEQLETHFLGNLLTLSNFFVLVTGRGRPYPWKVPYLIEAIRIGLGKFSIQQIQKQLEKFGISSILSVDDIYKIGDGWPLFTEHLARAKDRSEALTIAANILFAVVPVQEREQIRKYFEALCSLDGFGETEAELMVNTYLHSSDQDGRVISRKMNETRLVSWKDLRYEINEPVQKILRQYMHLENRDAWVRLNCAAYRHFEAQAKATDRSMERFRSYFEDQMKVHADALAASGITDPQVCKKEKVEETA
jgi:hypothetical protein